MAGLSEAWIILEPGLGLLEAAREGQYRLIRVPAANNLQANRKTVRGRAGGNRNRRISGEINWKRHAPADQGLDRFPADFGRSNRVAVRSIADGRNGERRRHDKSYRSKTDCRPSKTLVRNTSSSA